MKHYETLGEQMQVSIDLPVNIEGTWSLVNAEGEAIVSSADHPGAKLVVTPYFYRGQRSALLARTEVIGAKGKEVKQLLRVSATAGNVICEAVEAVPTPIVPKFDKMGNTKQEKVVKIANGHK